MTRLAWLTPDTPAPEEFRCRSISVPNDVSLVAAVSGALLPLTYEENWEQFGSMTPADAAAIMSAAFEAFMNSSCAAECPPFELPSGSRIWRVSPTTQHWEYLTDESEWVEPEGDDAIPAPFAREEEEETDRLCAAAANAVNVLYELYDQVTTDASNDIDALQAATNTAAYVSALLAGAFYPPAVAIIAMAEAVFNTFYELAGAISINLWDDVFTENLVCIFKSNATDTDGVVTFDFQAINRDILEQIWTTSTYVTLVAQVLYLTSIIGPQGLDYAGTTTAVEGDCSGCDTWCFDFPSWEGWEIVRGYLDGSKIIEQSPGAGWPWAAYTRLTVDTDDCQIRGIQATFTRLGGGAVSDCFVKVSPVNSTLEKSVQTNGGGITTVRTDDADERYSNTAETLLEVYISCGSSRNQQILTCRVWGTGVCPFGASTC